MRSLFYLNRCSLCFLRAKDEARLYKIIQRSLSLSPIRICQLNYQFALDLLRLPAVVNVYTCSYLKRTFYRNSARSASSNKACGGSEDNLTAVLYGINDLRLEQRPIPVPKDDEVLLKMDVVGICGSDVHYLVHGRIGPYVVEKPMVIGHEAAGTVKKVGKDVKHLKPGDRVAIEPGVGCRKCEYCRSGRYNLCKDMAFCATPPIDGNLTRYYVHPADFCVKLPDHVSVEEGALLEPLSVAVHSCKRGDVRFGSIVLILGAGPIGLVTVLASKAFGATKIVITDILQSRLDKAKQLGADCTLLISPKASEEEILQNIFCALGCRPTVSFDCVGIELTLALAVKSVVSGGKTVIIGMGGKAVSNIPINDILLREVDFRGVFRYVNDYPTALEMVATKKVDVKPLITHNYKIEDTLKAFHTSKTGEGNAIKVLIHVDPNWKN